MLYLLAKKTPTGQYNELLCDRFVQESWADIILAKEKLLLCLAFFTT